LGFKQRTVWGLNGNSDKHHDFPSQNSWLPASKSGFLHEIKKIQFET
jgi:hypothetical protein